MSFKFLDSRNFVNSAYFGSDIMQDRSVKFCRLSIQIKTQNLYDSE